MNAAMSCRLDGGRSAAVACASSAGRLRFESQGVWRDRVRQVRGCWHAGCSMGSIGAVGAWLLLAAVIVDSSAHSGCPACFWGIACSVRPGQNIIRRCRRSSPLLGLFTVLCWVSPLSSRGSNSTPPRRTHPMRHRRSPRCTDRPSPCRNHSRRSCADYCASTPTRWKVRSGTRKTAAAAATQPEARSLRCIESLAVSSPVSRRARSATSFSAN